MTFESEKRDSLSRQDKSIRGELDEQIRPLVDLLNADPRFYTTSSCSGRIVLLETPGEGKREAQWQFVSHEQVFLASIEQSLSPRGNLVWFKAESPIMHLCARTLADAQAFLVKAHECGFKRSGIISAKSKIVVEMVGDNRIDVPIAEEQCLVSRDYLSFLVREANYTLQRNHENLNRLYNMLRKISQYS